MHIFIDESGSFGGVDGGKSSVSVQGAIFLASHRLPKLFNRYSELRLSLPKNQGGEVKGSMLNEGQVSAVVDLLRRNDAIFVSSIIDMGDHTLADVEEHRRRGVEALARNLTDGHTPELRAAVAKLQQRMQAFSVPLYTQGMVLTGLLYEVMQLMIPYHCQRNPKELASFHWVVDGKERDLITDWEDWWSNTVVVWLQAMSISRPGAMLDDCDYRFFDRFLMKKLPDYIREFSPDISANIDERKGAGVDLQLMFREDFRFSSTAEPGLELVDIVTNALRRALVGNLRPEGWMPLRSLMINRRDGCVRPVSLHFEDRVLSRSYSEVLHHFRIGGRNMTTRE